MKKDDNFSYEINKEYDYIIEEAANTTICLRKISWGGRPEKIDIRKYSYSDGEEKMMKGVSLSDEGANELTNILAFTGYGDTKKLAKAIKSREDYYDGCENDIEEESEEVSEGEYYDPKMLIS
jgi:hypothetical protein